MVGEEGVEICDNEEMGRMEHLKGRDLVNKYPSCLDCLVRMEASAISGRRKKEFDWKRVFNSPVRCES